MKSLFINDCASYHAGSALVTKQFKRLCSEVGIIFTQDAKDAALAIVNGEGSMHSSAPRALQIIGQMEQLATAMPVVLLNTVWQKCRSSCAIWAWRRRGKGRLQQRFGTRQNADVCVFCPTSVFVLPTVR